MRRRVFMGDYFTCTESLFDVEIKIDFIGE
jgi:hypothetical protein